MGASSVQTPAKNPVLHHEFFLNESDNNFLPIIQIEMFNQKLYALCDTGSTINLIDESVVPTGSRSMQCSISLKTISQNNIEIFKKMNVNMIVDKENFKTEVYVSPERISKNFQVILGNEFLHEHNILIDYKDKTIKINDKKVIWLDLNRKQVFHVAADLVNFGYLNCKTILHPLSQTIVKVNIKRNFASKLFLAEPVVGEGKFFVAKSVHSFKSKFNIPILVLNPNNNPITLNKHSKLVKCEEVYSSDDVNLENFHIQEEKDFGDCEELDLEFSRQFKFDHLEPEVKEQLIQFLEKNKKVFASSVRDLPGCDTLLHKVPLLDSQPVKKKPYKVPYNLRDEMNSQINILLESGILEPSVSAYAAPVLLVRKSSGDYRLVTDFRALNSKVIPDSYPLPSIGEAVDNLSKGKFFSTLDLTSGFFQQIVAPEDRHKLAIASYRGLFQFTRTPFGLRTSANSFQRLMNIVLSGLEPFNIGVYIDDIIIASSSIKEHFPKLQMVFDRLIHHNLRLKPSKCFFLTETIKYLGFVINKGKVYPDQSNVDIVKNFQVPKNRKQVRQFLGCVNYYRKFISNISERSVHLTNLTKEKLKFQWNEEAEREFQDLRTALSEEPFLLLPDMQKDFHLYTDASNVAIGAVLAQMNDLGFPRPVAFGSRKLTPPETRYSVTEREALSIVFFTNYFRQYLLGRKFFIYTDHAPLSSCLKIKDSFCRIARWSISLSQFQFEIKYLPGKINTVADFLSRNVSEAEVVQSGLFLNEVVEEINPIQSDISYENLKLEQCKDEFCLKIASDIKSAKPNKPSNLEFYYHNDVLVCKDKNSSDKTKFKYVIPKSLIKVILEIAHDSQTSGHPGIKKTLKAIKKLYYWPKLVTHVVNWVKSCESCLERKAHQPKHLAHFQQIVMPNGPFEKIYFDIVGPLPVTEAGNKYLITFYDYLTKWVEVFPVSSIGSEVIADILLQFICRYGTPQTLVSDRGANLLSEGMRRIYSSLGIKKIDLIPFRPQGNSVERFHKSLGEILSHLVDASHSNWDLKIPYALLAYRTSEHESTNFTPAFLTFGREFSLPRQFLCEPVVFSYADHVDYATDLLNKMKSTYNTVKVNLNKAADMRGKRRDKVVKDIPLKVGDEVYWFNPTIKRGQCKKFSKHNEGPFEIVRFFSPVSAQLRHLRNKNYVRTVHVENITKVTKRFDYLTDPKQEGENTETIKERILAEAVNIKNSKENNNIESFPGVSEGMEGTFIKFPTPRYNLRHRRDGRVVRD